MFSSFKVYKKICRQERHCAVQSSVLKNYSKLFANAYFGIADVSALTSAHWRAVFLIPCSLSVLAHAAAVPLTVLPEHFCTVHLLLCQILLEGGDSDISDHYLATGGRKRMFPAQLCGALRSNMLLQIALIALHYWLYNIL